MDIIKDFNTLHHAHIIFGEVNVKEELLASIVEVLEFKTFGNPDFYFAEYISIGIDEARGLREWAGKKPLLGERKIAVLTGSDLTREAQNSLLKIFEEPPKGTHMFIVLKNISALLPTLLSRIVLVNMEAGEKVGKKSLASNFLSSTVGKRLDMIKKMSKEEDKSPMRELVSEIEKYFYQNDFKKDKLENFAKMKKVLAAKKFSSLRGASYKNILEWLALEL